MSHRHLVGFRPALLALGALLVPFAVNAAPPTGSIEVENQASFVNSTLVELTLNCTDDVACTMMQIATDGSADSEAFVAYSPTHSATVQGEGEHTIAVRFRNAALETSVQYTVDVTVDTTPPSLPPDLVRLTTSSSAEATFQWGASADTSGIDYYRVRVDGGSWVDVGTATTFTTSALAVGSHTFEAQSVDVAGNASATSQLNFSIQSSVDSTPPSNPTNLSAQATLNGNVSLSWTGSTDNEGVMEYQVSIDGGAYFAVGLSTSFTTQVLANGGHTLRVRAVDNAGNVSGSAEASVTVNVQGNGQTDTSFSLEIMEEDSVNTFTRNTAEVLLDLQFVSESQCEMNVSEAQTRLRAVLGTNLSADVEAMVNLFVRCGTVSTLRLGAGERLGVVNSFRAAFGRNPSTQTDWFDVIKIGNGRFTGQTSASAEANAQTRFRAIYLRDANMSVEADRNAVIVMAYGLRPFPRRLDSEVQAIIIFKAIFGHDPSSATDWDAVRAVAYSGATR